MADNLINKIVQTCILEMEKGYKANNFSELQRHQ